MRHGDTAERVVDARERAATISSRGRSRGDSTRFQHDHSPFAEQSRIEQRRRDTGRLARSGRSTQHDRRMLAECGNDLLEDFINRKRFEHLLSVTRHAISIPLPLAGHSVWLV